MLALRSYCLLGILLASGLPLSAQLDPEDAQVISYFPQLADGGGAAQQWTTALTFVNAHASIPAMATALIFGKFTTRLPALLTNLEAGCSLPGMPPFCNFYKGIYHPHLSAPAPLVPRRMPAPPLRFENGRPFAPPQMPQEKLR